MPARKYTLYFNPTPQMTAFELASVLLTMPLFGARPLYSTGIAATENEWKRIPPPLRKYFRKDNPFDSAPPRGAWEDTGGYEPKPAQTQAVPGQPQYPAEIPTVQIQGQPTGPENKVYTGKPAPKRGGKNPPSFYHDDVIETRDSKGNIIRQKGIESLIPEGMDVREAPPDAK